MIGSGAVGGLHHGLNLLRKSYVAHGKLQHDSPYRPNHKGLRILACLTSEFINDKDRIQNSGLYADYTPKLTFLLQLKKQH